MPVDTHHACYESNSEKWRIMRDTAEGELAVKAAGETYLPRLSGQENAAYCGYRDRAQFFNGTGRTITSLHGFIFRKNPEVVLDDALLEWAADCTLDGRSWYDYQKHVVEEVLTVGRGLTIIDFDRDEKRPYCAYYTAENVLNWKTKRVKGNVMLVLLTLFEHDPRWIPLSEKEKKEGPPDKFEDTRYDQYRVYELHTDGEGKPWVQCTVYRKKDPKQKNEPEFVAIEQFTPTRRGIALDSIPAVFHGASNSQPEVDKIPLLDMALVNLSLYRTSADLENGRHVAGTPTPWAAGFGQGEGKQGEEEELVLGCDNAWVAQDPQAKCGFLEFEGTGLKALETAVSDKKGEMAALGARMLDPNAKKAEAFDTVAMRAAGETSALMAVTIASTQSLSEIMRWVAWWLGTAEDRADYTDTAKTELNTEFTIYSLPSDMITALVQAYLQGALNWDSLFWKLQQGEIIPPDAVSEEVRADIDANPPAMLKAATAPPPGDPANA